MEDLHRSIFPKELKSAFPQLKDDINTQYGLLHLEMHVFADFAQRCINWHGPAFALSVTA
jgi:hypothetical protein